MKSHVYILITGADPGFQVRGGGGGRTLIFFWGISCEKPRFYPKKSNFFQLRREARKFWGISCEKSRFYAKKIIFFPILGGRAPGAPPGSAPELYSIIVWSS